ncbi:Uncharacterized protein HZ326_0915 [Fusarium oxysporum f. sp. albedinis]|nr:Uncharacterized protein HZ326_0915 [Fusarium oxysporum f. sp. albedinis]
MRSQRLGMPAPTDLGICLTWHGHQTDRSMMGLSLVNTYLSCLGNYLPIDRHLVRGRLHDGFCVARLEQVPDSILSLKHLRCLAQQPGSWDFINCPMGVTGSCLALPILPSLR